MLRMPFSSAIDERAPATARAGAAEGHMTYRGFAPGPAGDAARKKTCEIWERKAAAARAVNVA